MNTPNPDELREEHPPVLVSGGERGKHAAKPLRLRLLRWLQFRLRTLLVVMLLICAALAWWVWYTRKEPPSSLLPPGSGPWVLLSESGEKVRSELSKPTEMGFTNVPLPDAVAYLRDLHAIDIRLDEAALRDAKIDPESVLLTCDIRRIKLEEALTEVFWRRGLYTHVEEDALVITTFDAVSKRTVTKLYSLADLPVKDSTPGTIRRLIRETLESHATSAPEDKAVTKSSGPAAAAAKPKRPSLDERLRVVGAALIFRGTHEEHGHVGKLLKQLREATAQE